MPRIRAIKPEFFRNEQLAELPFEDRLLFIGLWTQADKAGRLEDRPKRLKGELFPYDDLNIDDALGRLANAGLIVRYEGNGLRLIAIPTWHKHQQPHIKESVSTLPAPGPHGAGSGVDPGPPPASTPDPDQEGKDQEGNGRSTPHALRARFERFWAVYPRKVGKDAAWAIWQRKAPSEALTAEMLTAVDLQARSPQWHRDGGLYVPHPRTWLSQGRWQDAIDVTAGKPRRGAGLDAILQGGHRG
jgi:hypothetical protein